MASARQIGSNPNTSTYGGSGQGRDYTSLATWEAATDVDLVTATQSEHLACYDDEVFDDSVTIAGATSNSTYYRSIAPAEGHAHAGTPGSGVRFASTAGTATFQISEANVRLHDLVVQHTGNSAGGVFGLWLKSGSSGVLAGIISYAATNQGAGTAYGLSLSTPSADWVLVDCLVSEAEGPGIHMQTNASAYLYNCTSVDNGTHGMQRATGTVVAKNCLSSGNGSDDFNGTFDAASSYNASSDTTAPGSNSRTEQSVTFVNAASDDYHLAVGDTGAKGFGTDLSGDATFPFDDDIDGDTITEWSIGADAQVAAGGGLSPGHDYQHRAWSSHAHVSYST